jgi:hypothetical protein
VPSAWELLQQARSPQVRICLWFTNPGSHILLELHTLIQRWYSFIAASSWPSRMSGRHIIPGTRFSSQSLACLFPCIGFVQVYGELVRVRRHLHAHPELYFKVLP